MVLTTSGLSNFSPDSVLGLGGLVSKGSARWFDGWRPEAASRLQEASGTPEVAHPRTWLLRVGWRRHGLVDPGEVPGMAAAAPA